MDIRAYKPSDIPEAKRIFDKFYSKDANGSLEFTDFVSPHSNYLCAFTVLGNDGRIVTTGGVRVIPEVTLITDKERSVRERVMALRQVLSVAGFITRDANFSWLHAVTDDPIWANQMQEAGFVPRGQDLEINVRDIR